MKVRVTIDVSDVDRIILGAAIHDTFVNASHEEIVEAITNAYEFSMLKSRKAYSDMTQGTVDAIKESLGL